MFTVYSSTHTHIYTTENMVFFLTNLGCVTIKNICFLTLSECAIMLINILKLKLFFEVF